MTEIDRYHGERLFTSGIVFDVSNPHKPVLPLTYPKYADTLDFAVFGTNGIIDRQLKDREGLVEASDLHQACGAVACRFTNERLGLGDIGAEQIYGIPEDYDTEFDGFASPLGLVASRGVTDHEGQLDTDAETSILVHEYAHASGYLTRKNLVVTNIKEQEGKKIACHTGHMPGGFKSVKITRNEEGELDTQEQNHFLEEAFAELVAADYNRQSHGTEGSTTFTVDFGLVDRKFLIPEKYTQRSVSNKSTLNYSNSAIPAITVELLSECADVDIYQLMIKSRNPEYEASAKRQIIQAIESVQTGLYRKLRECPYKLANFIDIYDQVVAIVESKKAIVSGQDSDQSDELA